MVKDGVCEYCGQAVLEGQECKCSDAVEEKTKFERLAEANNSINFIFGKDLEEQLGYSLSESALQLLELAAIAVNDLDIDNLTLKVNNIKAKISLGADNKIKIERNISLKKTDEVV